MKKKLKPFRLPLIKPDRKTHSNFFSVCIKAIEDNKEGILDKKDCIKKIYKLKEEKLKIPRKKNIVQTTVFKPIRKIIKIKVLNKRRNLSQIISENEQYEGKYPLKNTTIIKDLDQNKTKEIIKIKNINSTNLNHKKLKLMKINIPNNENNTIDIINRKKEKEKTKTNKNIGKRYNIFKKIMEYLESNNIALFELLIHNPFQKKPYEIPKGFEFLEAVKFNNYKYIIDALQFSNDFLFVFDYFGQTCYHWAAKLGNIKMLKLLIEYGRHHNQKDFKGRTPLYLAAVNNNREVCDFLLKNKANIHLKDKYGNSPADVAGSKELRYYLGDIMTQPYSNPIYKQKIVNFMRKRYKNIEETNKLKKTKEIEEKKKLKKDDENEDEENS